MYFSGGNRPIKVRFSTQTAAEYVLRKTRLSSKAKGIKEIYIRRNMNKEERNKGKDLREETKVKKLGENTKTGRQIYVESGGHKSKKVVVA